MKPIIFTPIFMLIFSLENAYSKDCNDLVRPFFQKKVHYLSYVSGLREKQKAEALLELKKLKKTDKSFDNNAQSSKYINKFNTLEEKFLKKFPDNPEKLAEYRERYNNCHSFTPNAENKSAVSSFKKFNMGLSLTTFGASYTYYNMDKEKDQEWYVKLGYDLFNTVLFSYFGSKIQGNIVDSNLTKGIKNYFFARILGFEDILFYDSIVSTSNKKAEQEILKLKDDPEFKTRTQNLMSNYKASSFYRQFRDDFILKLKNLNTPLSMNLKKNSLDDFGVDWNNISKKDLDNENVQDILILAAMAEIYESQKIDQIIASDNLGLDRYIFNTLYYSVQIPRNIAQSYITFQLICMGQDNLKLAFFKAALFNTSISVFSNQFLFSSRDTLINQ